VTSEQLSTTSKWRCSFSHDFQSTSSLEQFPIQLGRPLQMFLFLKYNIENWISNTKIELGSGLLALIAQRVYYLALALGLL